MIYSYTEKIMVFKTERTIFLKLRYIPTDALHNSTYVLELKLSGSDMFQTFAFVTLRECSSKFIWNFDYLNR